MRVGRLGSVGLMAEIALVTLLHTQIRVMHMDYRLFM